MGNPSKKFKDYQRLRQEFDGSDKIINAVTVRGNGRAGHDQRVANAPEWAMNNAALRALLLRAFPRMETSPTQRARAGRWARIISLYFSQGCTALDVAMTIRYDDSRKPARTPQGRDATNAKLRLMSEEEDLDKLTKRVEDTLARILRAEQGLRTDGKPRIGKMGRPRKV
jgi:hypothetical protein